MEEVFKITKDKERANDLFRMAKERLDIMKLIPRDKYYKLVEEYYEIIKELLTSIMYLDGYKTLSHVKLLEYFSINYKELDQKSLKLLDDLRKLRISIVYYGKFVNEYFLRNNEESIKTIIKILLTLVESKLKRFK